MMRELADLAGDVLAGRVFVAQVTRRAVAPSVQASFLRNRGVQTTY